MEGLDQICPYIPENDIEKYNFGRVFRTFATYREIGHELLNRKQRYVEKMPFFQRVKLGNYIWHLNRLRECLNMNAYFIQAVIRDVKTIYYEGDGYAEYLYKYLDRLDPYSLNKLIIIFRQIMREWSKEGRFERANSFNPIIEEIRRRFHWANPPSVKILFPGAGLGRLPYEVSRLGFDCEGNEHSLFMLFVSDFILNRATKGGPEILIYPFIHSFENIKSNADQLLPIIVPDTPPDNRVDMTMTCGDFIEIYSKKFREYDCVATCFFLDCPANPVAVTEVIYQVLKPGGFWINNGPLKYHHDVPEFSIQLSKEDLRKVIVETGFTFTKEGEVTSGYFDNPRSMGQSFYRNWYFVCQKTLD